MLSKLIPDIITPKDIPKGLISLPLKWRDSTFDVRMVYYLGMFVALLFMLAKLRYWR
ncbi:hypothetical protein [Moraxella catarrhalis]|uniref:hypothetical protein n=1 Tax=Moraxella catarrhalis TaxID=480 RepID=UPI0018844D9C|nr:hypothetical protein [Moraxella catarrhalis]